MKNLNHKGAKVKFKLAMKKQFTTGTSLLMMPVNGEPA